MGQSGEDNVSSRAFTFVGGASGRFRVTTQTAIIGENLPLVLMLDVVAGWTDGGDGFVLHGVTSNDRYVTQREKAKLAQVQEGLGRPNANRVVMIPIQKSDAWWNLAVDDRRAIIEQRSNHIATGARYLPQVARRLHHCRDMPWREPFDFITWFEFSAEHEGMFDSLVTELRRTEEWTHVTREVELRMTRVA